MPADILHTAVLSGDLPTLRLMRDDRILKNAKDSNGFTAVELAHLLNKTQCLKVLREWNPSKLKIRLKNTPNTLVELNEADINELLGFRYVQTLTFQTYEFFLETLKNCPLIFRYPPLSLKSKNLGEIYSTHKRTELTVKWIDDKIGYGLFNDNCITQGTLIGEYTGMVRRLDYKKPDPNSYCAHYPTKWWSKGSYTVIDAESEGNELRYINHSDNPNLKSAWANDRNLLHLLFFAKQDIPAHSQLTINYGPDFWQFRKKYQIDNVLNARS